MKTIHYVSHLVLVAAACFGCSGAESSASGSLESTLTAPVVHCGGNIANAPGCPDGFECVPNPASHLPFGDVGGICQAVADDTDGSDDGAAGSDDGAAGSDDSGNASGGDVLHCGGNIANAPGCPDGFECVPNPASHLPFGDVGGICQAVADDTDGDGATGSDAGGDDSGNASDGGDVLHCGGNIANAPGCPDGFECVPNPASHLPFGDVGGICQAVAESTGPGDHGTCHDATHD